MGDDVISRDELASELRKNAEALKSWMNSVSEQQREAMDGMFGRGYPLEQRAADALAIGFRVASSVIHLAETTANALDRLSPNLEGEKENPNGRT